MRGITCALGVVGCLIAGRAEADVSKAWAAAKDNLPANTQFVLAIDVAAATKTAMFAKVFEQIRKEDRSVEEVYTLLKTGCNIDPISVIDGVVIAGNVESKGAGIAFVQLTIDRAKASACLESALKTIGKKKQVTVKQDGIYTVGSLGNDAAYFPWVAPNVVAISIRPDKKPMVDAWINQKTFSKSLVAGMVGKLDLKALATGAFASDKPIDSWVPVTKAYGSYTIGGGKLTGMMVATAVDAKTAQSMADDINKDMAKDMKRDKTPAAVKKVMAAISITAAGTDLTIKGSVTEKELAAALDEAIAKKRKRDVDVPIAPPAPTAPAKK